MNLISIIIFYKSNKNSFSYKYKEMNNGVQPMIIKDIDQLNKRLRNYKDLSSKDQQVVRSSVIEATRKAYEEFNKKVQNSKGELTMLNLILGVTGVGKSTLFNYLNGVSMVVALGKNGKVVIDIEKGYNGSAVIAPIGHTFTSQTTVPNFCKPININISYVDCAGEFDTKDILQSIINSYFKYELANKAKQVKLTLVVNYHDIYANRATCFRNVLKEVGNFIQDWEKFRKSHSICLVVTSAPPRNKNIVNQLIGTMKDIANQVKDLGQFKPILEDIYDRKAVAVFLQPSLKIDENDQEIPPNGQKYSPNKNITSPELIHQMIQKTPFMDVNQDLFRHNLQADAQKFVNIICQQLIAEIKKEIFNLALQLLNQQNNLSVQQFQKKIQSKLMELENAKTIDNIIENFRIPNNSEILTKYTKLRKDLTQFHKISNISNIQLKMSEVSKDIKYYLKEQAANITKKQLDQAQKENENRKKQIQRKNAEIKENNLKIKNLQQGVEIKKLQLQGQQKLAQLQIKLQQKQHANQIQKQRIKAENDVRKAEIQAQAKNKAAQTQNQKLKLQNKIQMSKIQQLGNIQSAKMDFELKKYQQQNSGMNKFLNLVGTVVETVLPLAVPVGKQLLNSFFQPQKKQNPEKQSPNQQLFKNLDLKQGLKYHQQFVQRFSNLSNNNFKFQQ